MVVILKLEGLNISRALHNNQMMASLTTMSYANLIETDSSAMLNFLRF